MNLLNLYLSEVGRRTPTKLSLKYDEPVIGKRAQSSVSPAKIYDIRPHQQGRCGGSLSGDGSQDDLGDQIQWWWWTLARRRGRMFWRRHHTMSSLNENSRENYMESHYSNDRVISLEETWRNLEVGHSKH